MRLSAEDRPEDIYAITPLERGSLVHDILEKFVNTVRAQNSLPAPTEAWSEDHHRELRRIANEHFKEAEARGVTGKSVMWQIARDEMLIDLERIPRRRPADAPAVRRIAHRCGSRVRHEQ